MALNDVDNIYGTDEQVKFARKMAEALLKAGSSPTTGLPADVATLPYAGLNYGGIALLNSIKGAQYRDIAGSQDKNLYERKVPGQEDFKAPVTYGNGVSRTPTPQSKVASLAPFAPPSAPGIIKSDTPDTDVKIAPNVASGTPTGNPQYEAFINEVKRSENMGLFNGKQTSSKAEPDFKQYSNGYGTKAKHRFEVIDKPEAERRFSVEWKKAEAEVDKFRPGLDSGTRAALVSLTYNAGGGWKNQALGKAIQKGDMEEAKRIFLQYNRAGGKTNPVLVARRQKEVQWFGRGGDETTQTEPKVAALDPSSPELPLQIPPGMPTPFAGGQPTPVAPPLPGAVPPSAIPKLSEISQGMPPMGGDINNIPKQAALPPPLNPAQAPGMPPIQGPGISEIPKTPAPPNPLAMGNPLEGLRGTIPPEEDVLPPRRAAQPPPLPNQPGAKFPNNSPMETFQTPPSANLPGNPAAAQDKALIDSTRGMTDKVREQQQKIEDILGKIPTTGPSQIPGRMNVPGELGPRVPDFSGRMNLGGQGLVNPQEAQPGAEQAQYRSELAKPAQNPVIEIPGYRGPAPVMPPVISKKMLRARILGSPASEHGKILDDYHMSLSPMEFETPRGRLIGVNDPDGGPPRFTFLPKGQPAEPGTTVPDASRLGPSERLIVPGGGEGGDDRLTNRPIRDPETPWQTFTRDKAGNELELNVNQTLAQGKAKDVASVMERGMTANPVLKTIDTMDAISKATKDIPRGPTSPFMTALRQFADNFGIPIPEDTPHGEVLQKLNAGLASQATRAISNRGTNFELETFIKNNPGLLQTKDGMEMLLDVMRQEYRSYQDIAKIANRTKGQDIDSFYDKVDKYYEDNPVKFNYKLPGSKETIRVTTRKIRTRSDLDKLESGENYVTPAGTIGTKP